VTVRGRDMSYRLLLVEDDNSIRETIEDYLRAKGGEDYNLTVAVNGDEGRFLIESEEFDLLMLDIMLPGVDGFSLCRTARRKSDVPIIFLTARGREDDILYGYELGCDDYIVKPFSLPQLFAKVKALLSRAAGNISGQVMTCGEISLNTRTFQVFSGGREVELAPKEYEILHFLLRHKQNVCTRESILVALWGYEYEGDERILDNHMKKLRKALGDAGKQIKTVITKGYKLVEL